MERSTSYNSITSGGGFFSETPDNDLYTNAWHFFINDNFGPNELQYYDKILLCLLYILVVYLDFYN